MALIFDCETDGFLEECTKVHCLNILDTDTGQELRFNDSDEEFASRKTGTVADGVRLLEQAPHTIAHNGIAFDDPALRKLVGYRPAGFLEDTFVEARVLWTDIKDKDLRNPKVPNKYAGRHSLQAWGMRLGVLKDEYDGGFEVFTEEMDDYCMQDCRATFALWKAIQKKQADHPWDECLALEYAVQWIISRQMQFGWLFDVEAAEKLTAELLGRKAELEAELQQAFPPFYVRDGKTFIPKRDNKARGYTADVPLSKVKLVDFNPGSRQLIANRLVKVWDWTPTEFTDKGQPKVDEKTLETLAHIPQAALLIDYLTTCKRLGQIAEGNNAWLKHVGPDGRIRGAVNANGTVTGRMSHFAPNVAQADSYPPMRACWTVPRGKKLVGCDAEGIELRSLAHYQAPYDGGAFGLAVVEGNQDEGTDAHTLTQRAISFNKRKNAKTFRYALMYGAGDYKLGMITLDDMSDEKKARFYVKYPAGQRRGAAVVRLGKKRRAALMEGIVGFGELVDGIKKAAKKRGWLKGLDGRRIHCRSQHAALNTLLQSAGAVIMKKALVLMDQDYQQRGWVPGEHYEFVGNIHDEVQIEADEEIADDIGHIAADAIRRAGEFYNFRVPLAGKYDVGTTWAETH